MTNITSAVERKVLNSVAATLYRKALCTPKQALATAVIFAHNLDNLFTDSEEWVFQVSNQLDDLEVDGQQLDTYPALDALVRTKYIEHKDGGVVPTPKLVKLMESVNKSSAPRLATEGVVERKKGYSDVKHSKLFIEAVHALESSEYMRSEVMLTIAREVKELAKQAKTAGDNTQWEILKAEYYVLKGTSDMDGGVSYISEFSGDKRGRLYQVDCLGPNGQASDKARALMDLHGVSLDYDVQSTMTLLWNEMEDMGDFVNDYHMIGDMEQAVDNPALFIFDHVDKTNHITKAWNFTKFSLLYTQLMNGEKPYIGVAVGLDAKCSGPQLGACMVADQDMLAATGFTLTKLDDAYQRAITECTKVGITNLTRPLVKKAFMAIFYGAAKGSMLTINTIQLKTHKALYGEFIVYSDNDTKFTFISDSHKEVAEAKGEAFFKAISKSFGAALNKVRHSIKLAGYDFDAKVTKYSKPVRHTMPDGFEVAMEYMKKVDINGDEVTRDTPDTLTTIKSGFIDKAFTSMKFETDEYNLNDYARKGFVNMIQAVDALLARLIITHANHLGAQHIISVHDCFRVNIHDMAILQEAIKLAYLDLFGAMKNKPTASMPLGTDIIGMYFEGSKEATMDGYKASAPVHSQFFKNGTRFLRAVKGTHFKELVNALGVTYYFDK